MFTPPQNWKCCHYSLTRMSFQLYKSFVFGTLFQIFLIKTGKLVLWMSHWLPSKLHYRGSENNEKHCQGSPSAISGSIWILWSDENTFWTQRKKKNFFFNNWVSSLSLLVTVAPFWRLCTQHKQRTLFCIRLNARMRYFHSNQSVNTCRTYRRAYAAGVNSVIYLAVNGTVKPPGFYLKYLKLCSEDEQSFYRVGMTCG